MLRRADGPNLSNSCVSVAFLFGITRISTDQSTFVGYPSKDYRRYFVNRHGPHEAGLQHEVAYGGGIPCALAY